MKRGFSAILTLLLLCGCADNQMDREYGEKAVELKDASICEKIHDGFRRDVCFSQVCEIMQDFSICERIGDEHLRDIYYSRFAGCQMDESKCEKIINESIRKDCIEYVSKKKQEGR